MTRAEELCQQYRTRKDLETRAALVQRHLGLVRHAARALLLRVGDAVSYDDLVSAGSLGLVQALDGFDPGRGFAFATFAMQRIRGAMLDELRAADWRPRSVRVRGRQLQQMQRAIETATGRAALPSEVAQSLGVDVETYWQWKHDMEGGAVVSLQRAPYGSEQDAAGLAETLADPAGAAQVEAFEQQDRLAVLRALIAKLPERMRVVMSLSFFEGLTNRQIAQAMHVTESRISQMRTAGLEALRVQMRERGAL